MATIARQYNNDMGQTGAGIETAADIDMDQNNAFTTKWGMCLLAYTAPVV